MSRLATLAVKAEWKNAETYQDGDELSLKLDKRGGYYWLLRLQRVGQRQDTGSCRAKFLPLVEARQKASKFRKAAKIDRRNVLAERRSEAAGQGSRVKSCGMHTCWSHMGKRPAFPRQVQASAR